MPAVYEQKNLLADESQQFASPRTVKLYRLQMVKDRDLPYGPRKVKCPVDVVSLGQQLLAGADREHMVEIALDAKNNVKGLHVVAVGALDGCVSHPREVFKFALLANAAAIIMVHNHPSGDPTPSPEDDNVTSRLNGAAEVLGITLLDHVILGNGKYYSYKEHNRLN